MMQSKQQERIILEYTRAERFCASVRPKDDSNP